MRRLSCLGIATLLVIAGPLSAQDARPERQPASWLNLGVGAARSTPCPTPQHCDRFALDAELVQGLSTTRYAAARVAGLLELTVYADNASRSGPTLHKRGELAVLYGGQWLGRFGDARLGTGIAYGIDQRTSDSVAIDRGYIGLPIDAQLGVRLGRDARLMLSGLATFGSGISYRAVTLGISVAFR